jgi:hypothetical protein
VGGRLDRHARLRRGGVRKASPGDQDSCRLVERYGMEKPRRCSWRWTCVEPRLARRAPQLERDVYFTRRGRPRALLRAHDGAKVKGEVLDAHRPHRLVQAPDGHWAPTSWTPKQTGILETGPRPSWPQRVRSARRAAAEPRQHRMRRGWRGRGRRRRRRQRRRRGRQAVVTRAPGAAPGSVRTKRDPAPPNRSASGAITPTARLGLTERKVAPARRTELTTTAANRPTDRTRDGASPEPEARGYLSTVLRLELCLG